jgi:hypothetical protein
MSKKTSRLWRKRRRRSPLHSLYRPRASPEPIEEPLSKACLGPQPRLECSGAAWTGNPPRGPPYRRQRDPWLPGGQGMLPAGKRVTYRRNYREMTAECQAAQRHRNPPRDAGLGPQPRPSAKGSLRWEGFVVEYHGWEPVARPGLHRAYRGSKDDHSRL